MLRRSSSSSLLVLSLFILCSAIMAHQASGDGGDSSSSAPAVHIVYTERPVNEQAESYHLRTLASVLGSEEAAKDALIYCYTNAASGFSAKLTPEQVSQISKQPGVLQVVPSRTLQLHSGPATMRHSGPAMLHKKM